jgi:hypothetical protein
MANYGDCDNETCSQWRQWRRRPFEDPWTVTRASDDVQAATECTTAMTVATVVNVAACSSCTLHNRADPRQSSSLRESHGKGQEKLLLFLRRHPSLVTYTLCVRKQTRVNQNKLTYGTRMDRGAQGHARARAHTRTTPHALTQTFREIIRDETMSQQQTSYANTHTRLISSGDRFCVRCLQENEDVKTSVRALD